MIMKEVLPNQRQSFHVKYPLYCTSTYTFEHNSLNMANNLVKLTIDQDLEEKKIQTVVDLQLAVQQVGY